MKKAIKAKKRKKPSKEAPIEIDDGPEIRLVVKDADEEKAVYDEAVEIKSLLYSIQKTLDHILDCGTYRAEVDATREQLIVAATHARRLLEEKRELGKRIESLENQARTCHWCREFV